jgi:hypothetical protein
MGAVTSGNVVDRTPGATADLGCDTGADAGVFEQLASMKCTRSPSLHRMRLRMTVLGRMEFTDARWPSSWPKTTASLSNSA